MVKFDELDSKMRVFETAHDYCVLPGIYIVARLDGRGFTRLTKDVHKFKAPYKAIRPMKDDYSQFIRDFFDCLNYPNLI